MGQLRSVPHNEADRVRNQIKWGCRIRCLSKATRPLFLDLIYFKALQISDDLHFCFLFLILESLTRDDVFAIPDIDGFFVFKYYHFQDATFSSYI